ncbi:dihydrofolate reductase family protein [Nonomuraea sp. NPDC050556]|uniref:dihydrofolate reductase family protein n=1 Tax=Nonomuraea sp. NPDC050556 TaxID=3364369 RepID=UPI00379BCBF5
MRKLILRMLTSMDGFIADPKGDLRFGPHWSEDLQTYYADAFAEAGGLVFGRTVYEKYVPYWTGVADAGRHPSGPATAAEVRYATSVRDLPKYAVSTGLPDPAGNTTVLREDPAARIADLKREKGGDLLLMCGPSLLATLADHIDAYLLDVYPIALGQGTHLWRDLPEPRELHLAASRRFPGDVLVNTYTS